MTSTHVRMAGTFDKKCLFGKGEKSGHGPLDPPSNYRSSNHENPIKPDRIRHDMGKNSTKAIVCSLRYIPILSLCYKVVFFNDCAKNDTL